jgi:hypothetical protein
MNIDEFSYLWTTEKEEWVLVNTEFGYAIINKKTQMMLHIDSDELEEAIIQKMHEEGNKIYKDILDAYADV